MLACFSDEMALEVPEVCKYPHQAMMQNTTHDLRVCMFLKEFFMLNSGLEASDPSPAD